MLAIVIPAHNEAQYIGECLKSVKVAARHPLLRREPVHVIVVLDSCVDPTTDIVCALGVETLAVSLRNVGAARAAGARRALQRGARWLAFTDADTTVPPDWLVQQLAARADVFCGIVAVDDWRDHDAHTKQRFLDAYRPVDGHRHIHGANLGISASAYLRAGGFQALPLDEDVMLVKTAQRMGANIAWRAAGAVTTSSRKDFRVRGGFGESLLSGGPAVVEAEDVGAGTEANADDTAAEVVSSLGRKFESMS